MIHFLKRQLISNDISRTLKAKKNIAVSFILKVIDGIVYLALVPLTLNYLNPYEYGIWLTISSILMWINSFDIGLGNGLRNKLTEAIAKKDYELGKCYVTTTFVILTILMAIVISCCLLLSSHINWYEILNTDAEKIPHLNQIISYTFILFCVSFILKITGNVYLALQLPAINNLLIVLGHSLSLIFIFLLTKLTTGNLLWVALAYAGAPLIIYLIAYPITFFLLFPNLSPSLRNFRKKYIKDLFNIGIQFFVLQIASVIIFSTTNIFISHFFGPENVTPYNITYRYFSLVPMIMTLILSPIWSATTDAYTKGEIDWIKNTLKTIVKILFAAIIILIVMVLISPIIYKIWIGSKVHISISLSSAMAIYIAILICSTSYSNFLNGIGKLKIQLITAIIIAVLFIPLTYFISSYLGLIGVVISMSIINLPGMLLNYIQLNKILDNRASGVWNQ